MIKPLGHVPDSDEARALLSTIQCYQWSFATPFGVVNIMAESLADAQVLLRACLAKEPDTTTPFANGIDVVIQSIPALHKLERVMEVGEV